MDALMSIIQGIDLKNIDLLGILNNLIGIIKSLLGGFIGEKGDAEL